MSGPGAADPVRRQVDRYYRPVAPFIDYEVWDSADEPFCAELAREPGVRRILELGPGDGTGDAPPGRRGRRGRRDRPLDRHAGDRQATAAPPPERAPGPGRRARVGAGRALRPDRRARRPLLPHARSDGSARRARAGGAPPRARRPAGAGCALVLPRQ